MSFNTNSLTFMLCVVSGHTEGEVRNVQCLLIYDGGLCDSNLMVEKGSEVSPISYDTKICLTLCSSCHFGLDLGFRHGMLMDLCLSKRESVSVSISNLVNLLISG